MKKIALALACLFSVAFFASCDPEEPVIENPEPTIAILDNEGYLTEGSQVETNTMYYFGFNMASNPDTQKELASLEIVTIQTYNGEDIVEEYRTVALSGTEYTHLDSIVWAVERGDFINNITIQATVTDVDNQSKTTSFVVSVFEQDDEDLVPTAFEWRRDNGSDGSGLEEFGLKWTTNVNNKSVAVIEPLEDATLVVFEPEAWTNTETVLQKAALFPEGLIGIAEYKEISTTASGTYNLVIGTIYNGETHLIHITNCEVYERGWHFVITGEAK